MTLHFQGDYSDQINVTGMTNGHGNVYLVAEISALTSFGSPEFRQLQTFISGECINVLSSSRTVSTSGIWLFPEYTVIMDCDDNNIPDENEMPLAEKFCATYILNSSSDYIRPEPVQYMGVEKTDLWFDLYNVGGQFVETYQITQQSSFDPPISDWHGWVAGPGQFSFIDYDPAYDYPGKPPGKSDYGYHLRFHWNYAGNCDSESCWSSNYQTERTENNYRNTLYVHMFLYSNYVIIQYWTFYPYNDYINNHEGDWEHVNVWVNSQDPSTASIVKVEYYFHKKYLVRYPGSFEVDDATHPRVYVGGERPSWAPGVHSGGNYPEAKYWIDAGEVGVNEYVNGSGPVIDYFTFFDDDPNDKRGS